MGALTIDEVAERAAQAASDVMGCHYADVIGRSRLKTLSRARGLAYWLCLSVSDHSTTEIGNAFDRDHSTVLKTAKRISAKRATDERLSRQCVEMIERYYAE